MDVTSIDVLAPVKRFEVRRRLLIVLEVEGRVAAGQRILSEAALQPILDELFKEGTQFRKQLDGFAKARDRATNGVPTASNADLARIIDAQDNDRYKEPPAARTVLQWFRRWRVSGRNVLVLAGDYSRVGAKKINLHPKVQQHVDNALSVNEFAETLAIRYENAKLAILADNSLIEEENKRRLEVGAELLPLLEVPTQYLFRREAKKLGAFRKMICSKGLPAATRAFTALGAGLDVRAIGERVEMDCWECNLKVILEHAELFDLLSPAGQRAAERLKVWLVFAIDCASRVVLGIAFSLSSNVDAVLNARAQIGMDKTGIALSAGCRTPWNHRTGVQLLVADNGKEFTSTSVVTAEAALGEAAKAATPAAMPQMKGPASVSLRVAPHAFRARQDGRNSASG